MHNENPPFVSKVTERYNAAIQRILALALAPDGKKRTIEWGPDADEALEAFQRELEPRLSPDGGDLAGIADWGAKLPGLAVRLAAVLAIARAVDWDDPLSVRVDVRDFAGAREIAEWALVSARYREAESMRETWSWLTQRGTSHVAKQDAWQGLRHKVGTTQELDAALAKLVAIGVIRIKKTVGPKGGRPSETIILHPDFVSVEV